MPHYQSILSEDKEDATVEWKMLLDQLQAAEAAAGGVPA
jgi:hypothetical protein